MFKYAILVVIVSAACSTVVSVPSTENEHHAGVEVHATNHLAQDKGFIVYDMEANFFEAWHFCREVGARLATIRSGQDNDVLEQAIGQSGISRPSFWIAGTDLGRSRSWLWISTGAAVGQFTGYTNWDEGQPDNLLDNCIVINNNPGIKWRNEHCFMRHGVLCADGEEDSTEPTDPTDPTAETTVPNDTTDVTNPIDPPFPPQRYIIYDMVANFFEAWHFCREVGARMATVRSTQDNNVLKEELALSGGSRHSFWIAGTDMGRSRSWLWISTGTAVGQLTGFTNWDEGQPDNLLDNCIVIDNNPGTKWRNDHCFARQGVICAIDEEAPEPTNPTVPTAETTESTDTTDVTDPMDPPFLPQRYIIYDLEANFFEAWHFCREVGARMATVRSTQDNNLLEKDIAQSIVTRHSFWIAGTDLGRSRSWLWISTGTAVGQLTGFTNWDESQPDNLLDNCIAVNNSPGVKWSNQHCFTERGVICAVDEEVPTEPTDPTVPTTETTEPTDTTDVTDPMDPPFLPQRYITFDLEANFFEAWHFCREMGAGMATVRSIQDNNILEQDVALSGISKPFFWIAGTDMGRSRSWLWISTGTAVGQLTGYTNWDEGQPDNLLDNCITVSSNAGMKWRNQHCFARHGVICAVDEETSTEPADPTESTDETTEAPTEPADSTTTEAPTEPADSTTTEVPSVSTEPASPTAETTTTESTGTSSTTTGPPISSQRYTVFDEEVTFFEAWQLCRERGLRLANVRSSLDNIVLEREFAQSELMGQFFWSAGTDLGRPRHWMWFTTNRPVGHLTGYTNWDVGQPDNLDEHCIEISKAPGARWSNRGCAVRRGFLCENF